MTSRRRFLAAAGTATGAGITSVALPSAFASASTTLPPDPTGIGGGAGSGVWIHSFTIGLQSVNGSSGRWYDVGFGIGNNVLPETEASNVVVRIYALIGGVWTWVYVTPPQNFYLGGGFGGATYISTPTPDPPGNWRAVITSSTLPVVTDTASFSGVF